jgi:hypothetical protein
LRYYDQNETKLQKKLRLKRIATEAFVNNFWTQHNTQFRNQKEEFIKKNKICSDDNVSADIMSTFYKDFLDKNFESHFFFNIEWYLKNFELLFLALQVNIEKSVRRITGK